MAASGLTVGYVPPSFPRDPVDINQYLEHMFVGQVIEPLVDADKFGQVVAGIAKSWTFADHGKKLMFVIDSTRKFSDGRPVTCADVVFSIRRHLGSESQSSQFLADIKEIKAVGKTEVEVTLKRSNPGIIKALSRDQLGILPHDWRFDRESSEPYIGTGPYRLVRKKGHWTLTANSYFHRPEIVGVKEWDIKVLDGTLNGIPQGPLPDFIPSITSIALDIIKNRPDFKAEDYSERANIGYTQTTFWVYPTSTYYHSEKNRLALGQVLDQACDAFARNRRLNRATGVIPLGISGHNAAKPALRDLKGSVNRTLRLAYSRGAFDPFLNSVEFTEAMARARIAVELIPYDPPTLHKLHGQHIDIIAGSWAGGYSDPTGFLGLLTHLLGTEFRVYLRDKVALLDKATAEGDWDKRAGLFREFDGYLVRSGLLTPGWHVPSSSLIRKPLHYVENQVRYSERFTNVAR